MTCSSYQFYWFATKCKGVCSILKQNLKPVVDIYLKNVMQIKLKIKICSINNSITTYLCNHGVSFVNFAGLVTVAPNKLKAADIFIDVGGHEHIKPRFHVKRVGSLNPKNQILLLRAFASMNHPPMPQCYQLNLQCVITLSISYSSVCILILYIT